MKVLNLSLDSKILDKDSRVFQRMKWYSSIDRVESYKILIASSRSEKFEVNDLNLRVVTSGGNNRIMKFFKTLLKTFELVRKNNFDVITTQNPFELGLIAYLCSFKYNIGVNVQVHNEFFNRKFWRQESFLNFLRYYLGRFILKRVDSIRVVNKKIKDFLYQRWSISKEKIINAPVFTDIDQFNFDRNSNRKNCITFSGNFTFLSVGRFVKQKNLPLLIESFCDLSKKRDNARLMLVGKGPQKDKIEKKIFKNSLENKVIIRGWTENISYYYNIADTYVLSSNYEGWGRVIIEAAHSGLPIVMTDVGCAREVIEHKKEGLLVPPNNKNSLVSAMEEILDNKSLRGKIKSNLKNIENKLLNKEETLSLYLKSWQKAIK